MKRLFLSVLLGLSLVGCGGKTTVYIDSTTGEVVEPPTPKVQPSVMSNNHNLYDYLEVVCIEGVQYYNGSAGWGKVLTPRVNVSPTGTMTGYTCDDDTLKVEL